MDVVDFFCGAGGFSEGFHQAGFNIIKAFDIWAPAIKTHNKNHPSSSPIATYGDVEKISKLSDEEFENIVPDSEIIIGSPPCVAFSNSNKSGKGDKELGIRLLESYLRIVARKKFKENSKLNYWILENVKNVEPYIKEKYTMEELGIPEFGDKVLNVKYSNSKVYNVADYGVASNRKRYICGKFASPIQTYDNKKVLNDILLSLGAPSGIKKKVIKDPNYDFELNSSQLTDHYYIKEIASFEWKKARRHKQDKGYMGKMSFPENMNRPARTVMATMSASSRESMIFPLEKQRYRYPTIREVASIMSFPIDYRFYGESDLIKYKLVGNAVPPLFSRALANAILLSKNKNFTQSFRKKKFEKNDDFSDLNNKFFPLKEEKEKLWKTRFKYHVPYLIDNAFRVELQNYFDDEMNVYWKAEIHKGQGKSAKVYIINHLCLNFVEEFVKDKIQNFLSKYMDMELSSNKLQENYCLESYIRKNQALFGPEEVLQDVRWFVDSLSYEEDVDVLINELKIKIPIRILLSYYLLQNILNTFREEEVKHG